MLPDPHPFRFASAQCSMTTFTRSAEPTSDGLVEETGTSDTRAMCGYPNVNEYASAPGSRKVI